jgi:hypothetical protein
MMYKELFKVSLKTFLEGLGEVIIEILSNFFLTAFWILISIIFFTLRLKQT